jgi:hypothetical protein
VVSASFALHHIPTGRARRALQALLRVAAAGGMFVSADCYLADRHVSAAPSRRRGSIT